MTHLDIWAQRHGVPPHALAELRAILNPVTLTAVPPTVTSETDVSALIRVEASNRGHHLFRNNVGALVPEGQTRPVRFGLANDSKVVNDQIKSADLIGWRRLQIAPEHVGSVVAQFLSRESKAPGWTFRDTPRETAQLRWAQLVNANGGDAAFATGIGSL